MSDEIAALKADIARIAADALAAQLIVAELMRRLRDVGAIPHALLEKIFDDLQRRHEILAMDPRKAPHNRVHAANVLEIIEQVRELALKNE